MVEIASPSAAGATSAVGMHTARLRDCGFTVLTHAVVDAPRIERAGQAVCSSLVARLQSVADLGLDPKAQCYSFNDVCHRSSLRWDLEATAETRQISEIAMGAVAPIVSALHRLPLHAEERGLAWTRRLSPRQPRLVSHRALLSRPGAAAQKFHFDARLPLGSILPSHRLFNVFVPLVDIEEGDDGTQFLPGSHLGGARNRICREALARSGQVRRTG